MNENMNITLIKLKNVLLSPISIPNTYQQKKWKVPWIVNDILFVNWEKSTKCGVVIPGRVNPPKCTKKKDMHFETAIDTAVDAINTTYL